MPLNECGAPEGRSGTTVTVGALSKVAAFLNVVKALVNMYDRAKHFVASSLHWPSIHCSGASA